jgi:hypothetical protein
MKRFNYYAKGTQKPGEMNNLEAQFAQYLELLKRAGEIEWYSYEGIRLRLAKNTTYTPDFFVMKTDGALVVYEVKGRWLDDARVKIKVAAELFPFPFIGVSLDRETKSWRFEEF